MTTRCRQWWQLTYERLWNFYRQDQACGQSAQVLPEEERMIKQKIQLKGN